MISPGRTGFSEISSTNTFLITFGSRSTWWWHGLGILNELSAQRLELAASPGGANSIGPNADGEKTQNVS
jgi:hypothetical protein